ncbi:hypothetical protein HID58_072832 [Brassica napus]|uniref:Protein kinase domain-containing protein n=1 Tax=Brassica napus TaxID=3708 RepID=A0ABQ7Z5T1_BRANA|nr:hypothetical protein HID58_072832 [Brassica napus]
MLYAFFHLLIAAFKRPTSKRGNDERPVLFQLGSIASDARLKDDPEITNSRPASPSLSPSSSGNNNAKERKLSDGACASSFVGRFQGDQQFDAEILSLETVRHPNLVMLIGYHASETEMFLIYNYLSGGNLEDFIKERSKPALEWKILQKIALDVARAVAYLHEQCSAKVLHRDIKPSNILLDNNYNAYLSDFGLSKLLGTSQSHVTTTGGGWNNRLCCSGIRNDLPCLGESRCLQLWYCHLGADIG